MRTYNITIDYLNQAEVLKESDRPPECSLATAWVPGDLGLFRVNMSVVDPKAEEPQHYLSLSSSEAQDIVQAVANLVELLKEKSR